MISSFKENTRLVKAAIARGAVSRPGRALFSWILGKRVAIFTLHRFHSPGSDNSGHDPRFLGEVLSELRSRNVPILSLQEVVSGLAQDRAMQGVCFTVDDGYQNFFHYGAPVFQEFDCPVTVFLTTGFIDGDYWFWWDRITYAFQHSPLQTLDLPLLEGRIELGDRHHRKRIAKLVSARLKDLHQAQRRENLEAVLERLETEIPHAPPAIYEPLSWEQIRSLSETGIEFGPHSVRHLSLRTAELQEVREEVHRSFARLREQLPASLPVFCYPYGTETDTSREVAEIVEEENMMGAVTTIPGYVRCLGSNPTSRFLIPRFGLPNDPMDFRQVVYGVERGKEIFRRVVSPVSSFETGQSHSNT